MCWLQLHCFFHLSTFVAPSSAICLQRPRTRRDVNDNFSQRLYDQLEHVPTRLGTLQERQLECTQKVNHVHEHIHRVEDAVKAIRRENNKEPVGGKPMSECHAKMIDMMTDMSDSIEELRQAVSKATNNVANSSGLSARDVASIGKLEMQVERQREAYVKDIAKAESAKLFAELQLQKHMDGKAAAQTKQNLEVETTLRAEHQRLLSETQVKYEEEKL